jgi:hypothetical protein
MRMRTEMEKDLRVGSVGVGGRVEWGREVGVFGCRARWKVLVCV